VSGGVIEIDDGEGVDLCKSGLAEPVADRVKEERAVATEPAEVRVAEPEKVADVPAVAPAVAATGSTPRPAAKR
jgi:hypothetical protein